MAERETLDGGSLVLRLVPAGAGILVEPVEVVLRTVVVDDVVGAERLVGEGGIDGVVDAEYEVRNLERRHDAPALVGDGVEDAGFGRALDGLFRQEESGVEVARSSWRRSGCPRTSHRIPRYPSGFG